MISRIVLTGMMGAGKSAVARELGEALSLPVIDLDDEIERTDRRSIPAIFEEEGEARFREIETESLRKVCRSFSGILSTGGGIVLLECNRTILSEWGKVVYLRADASVLAGRLAKEGEEGRPLLEGVRDLEKQLASILEIRRPLYEESAVTVDTDLLNPKEVCRLVLASISS